MTRYQSLLRNLRMTRENPSWGEERIANELLLKLGLRVSPRTVRKYLPKRLDRGGPHGVSSQRWRTFVRCLLNEWVPHDNEGRPHMALGPGIPQPPPWFPVPLQARRHRIPEPLRVVVRPILGGLHHEYGLEENAA